MEEALEYGLVFAALRADGESGSQLRDDVEWNADPGCSPEYRDRFRQTVDDVSVTIGTDRDIYCHTSPSIVS